MAGGGESVEDELRSVGEQLQRVEKQLATLLAKQQSLLERQQLLQMQLQQKQLRVDAGFSDKVKCWARTDFDWSADLKCKALDFFGIESFRPYQLETMNATLANQDCILIMPTGGGKSLCFQLPALVTNGITLVISPLVALMEDQLLALHKKDIPAVVLNAETGKQKEVVHRIHTAMVDPNSDLKLVYVTPEKLSKSKRFMSQLEKCYGAGRLGRIAVDEIHCCSQWGHDFRPDYQFLNVLKSQFPRTPILGLTATATVQVLQDVQRILNIPNCIVFKASFNRKNLYYEVRVKPSIQKAIIDDMSRLVRGRFGGQSGIVYCLSQKETEDIADQLCQSGITAACYHAGLSAQKRTWVHNQWLHNQLQVVVATIAFGMGIDKPDVRFVIHHSVSKSMENYYQESGRAGRDSNSSHCIVYFRAADIGRLTSMIFGSTSQAKQQAIGQVYSMGSYCIERSRCRRHIIAAHFGEAWTPSLCQGMCDFCDRSQSSGRRSQWQAVDVRSGVQQMLGLVQKAGRQQNFTIIQLADAWRSANKHADHSLSRDDAEWLIVKLLADGYLAEEFKFTSYNCVSYLKSTAKGQQFCTKPPQSYMFTVEMSGRLSLSAAAADDTEQSSQSGAASASSQRPTGAAKRPASTQSTPASLLNPKRRSAAAAANAQPNAAAGQWLCTGSQDIGATCSSSKYLPDTPAAPLAKPANKSSYFDFQSSPLPAVQTAAATSQSPSPKLSTVPNQAASFVSHTGKTFTFRITDQLKAQPTQLASVNPSNSVGRRNSPQFVTDDDIICIDTIAPQTNSRALSTGRNTAPANTGAENIVWSDSDEFE